MVTFPPQLSVAVGVPTGGIGSLQAIVTLDGIVRAGLPLSTTEMRCEMEIVLLQLWSVLECSLLLVDVVCVCV